VFDYMALRH